MKPTRYLLATMIITSLFYSCKKTEVESQPIASLNVINAVIGGGNVKLNTNYRDSAKMYNAKSFALNAVDGTIRLYSTADSLKPYYLKQHELTNGGVYSMFLFGGAPSPEYIFMEDVPARYTDSAVGIRVVNLASGSGPLNITLGSDTLSNILENIAYKDVTDFFKLPLTVPVPAGSTKFEIRDAGTNTVLASYTLPTSANSNYPGISVNLQRFKGITLVVKGLAGMIDGPDAFGVFPAATSY